jgi:hypothetical protein
MLPSPEMSLRDYELFFNHGGNDEESMYGTDAGGGLSARLQ